MSRSYGGYLPLEIQIGEDYFSQYDPKVLRTNSGKSAIYHALKQMNPGHLHVPYYLCGSVSQMIEQMGIPTSQYYLHEDMTPDLKNYSPGDVVFLVNYFGMMGETINEVASLYDQVIVDQCHALFAAPILRSGVYNAYSCKKFIGVPDGGYLVSEDLNAIELPAQEVRDHFQYLVISSEVGTEASYAEKRAADRIFDDHFIGMSEISQGIMSMSDLDAIAHKRRTNAHYLHEKLKDHNAFNPLHEDGVLYLYPFLPKNPINRGSSDRGALKKALVEQRIYVPTLWSHLTDPSWDDMIEGRLSSETAFLPIDQRYDTEDMEHIAQAVLDYLTAE